MPPMPRVHTHYDNLKVARDAPPEVIRAAYKTLSQKYHPDRNGNSPEAIRVIQIINSAYAILSNPEKRREHDEWIARAEAQDQRSSDAAFRDHSVRYGERRPSRRSRRRSFFSMSRSRHSHPPSLQKALLKLCHMLDQFSRKLFGRT